MLRPRPLPPSPFSSPMNFSYGPTRPHQPSPSRDSSRPSDSALIGPTPGPSGAETIHLEPDSHGERGPGTDWSNELSDWIESHKYYPEQAAMNGEEGTAEVRVTIDRYGHVKTVELVSRSGSIWLDMASQALFRDRTVPPLPPDSPLQTVTFDLTTHYILIRR
jgi:TonB family protein